MRIHNRCLTIITRVFVGRHGFQLWKSSAYFDQRCVPAREHISIGQTWWIEPLQRWLLTCGLEFDCGSDSEIDHKGYWGRKLKFPNHDDLRRSLLLHLTAYRARATSHPILSSRGRPRSQIVWSWCWCEWLFVLRLHRKQPSLNVNLRSTRNVPSDRSSLLEEAVWRDFCLFRGWSGHLNGHIWSDCHIHGQCRDSRLNCEDYLADSNRQVSDWWPLDPLQRRQPRHDLHYREPKQKVCLQWDHERWMQILNYSAPRLCWKRIDSGLTGTRLDWHNFWGSPSILSTWNFSSPVVRIYGSI